ncbi:MAG: NUDIX hydrolase [Cellvibrionaceae bacterium]
MKFCSTCGTHVNLTIPSGDNRERFVCVDPECGTIHYQNPRIITGCLPTYQNQVLLCKRAIEPRYGLWTLPAGFLENGESTEQGAKRESWEEAKANLEIEQLYTLFDLPHINQVYFFFKASLSDTDFGPGEESLEVELFNEEDIPWEHLAFPVIERTLKLYFEDRKAKHFPFRSQVIKPSQKIL